MESQFTKNRIVSELTKSPHGKLEEYIPIIQQAAAQEPEFLAHLVSWNRIKGNIRDSKVAMPIVSLTVPQFVKEPEFAENSLAHFVSLGPRELLRAYRFALTLRPKGFMTRLAGLIESFLRDMEADRPRWDRVALQHRRMLRELYTLAHIKSGSDHVSMVLHHGKLRDKAADGSYVRGSHDPGSVFELVARLKEMSPGDAASAIITNRIPFLVAAGELEEKMKEPELLHALITRMSPTELVTNAKMIEKLGVKDNPMLRGALEEGLKRASTSKASILKTTKAAQQFEDDGEEDPLREKLVALQERQIEKMQGIEGDWLVLGDKSPSMQMALESAKLVAATLAKFVKGKVSLIFFDSSPRYFDVTNMTYDQILKETRHVLIGGGTSIGCGVQYAIDNHLPVDGIAVVSDAAENTPPLFVDRYKALSQILGKEPPVYLYRFACSMMAYADRDLAYSMRQAGLDIQEFDLRGQNVDLYSLQNLVATMRVARYSLVDEILNTELRKVNEVLKWQPEVIPV